MAIGGYVISKDKQNRVWYWFIPIMAYSLNVGMRFGRGTDYMIYANAFQSFIDGESGGEPLWHYLCYFIGHELGSPWPVMVFFMSFVLISSICYFTKDYKEILPFALPLSAFYSMLSENLSRWYFAFSFLLVSLYFLINRFEKKSYVFLSFFFASCALLTHYGILFVLIVLLAISFKKSILLKPNISISLLLVLFFFASLDSLNLLASIAPYLNLFGRYDDYVSDLSRWMTHEDQYAMGFEDLIIYILVLYYGYNITRENEKLIPIYNITATGIIVAPMFKMLELTFRMTAIWTSFIYIFIGYLFYDAIIRKRTGLLVWVGVVIIFVLRKTYNLSFMQHPSELLYIWDVNYQL